MLRKGEEPHCSFEEDDSPSTHTNGKPQIIPQNWNGQVDPEWLFSHEILKNQNILLKDIYIYR